MGIAYRYISIACCIAFAPARLVGDEAMQAALEKRVDSLEELLKIWTAIVVLGLLYEYGYELAETPKAWPTDRPWPFRWAKSLEKLGAIMVVIGVAGELYVEVAASPAHENLRRLSNERIKLQEMVIADSKARAMGAEVLVASAKAQAAKAELGTAAARLVSSPKNLRVYLSESRCQAAMASSLRTF